MIEFRRIMLPVDFSDHCDRAAEYATWFVRQTSATIHLVHVVGNPADPLYEPQEVSYWIMVEHAEQKARELLETAAQKCLPAAVARECHLLVGDPFEKLMYAAEQIRPDLIIMASHGRGGGLTHLVMGGVAEKIVRHAPQPVLVVRPLKA
jgi:universal stress protein A